MSDAAIVKREPLDFLTHRTFREKLAAAIPNAMLKPDRFLQLAITLIKSNTLLKCTPISLMACVMEAAQLGLELDPVLGHAYMVPFKDQATLIVGYRGFAQLMYQSGQVIGISAEVVRAKDKFRFELGTRREIVHVPGAIPKKDHWESWRGAYAVARMISNTYEFEYMEAEKIHGIRARSQSWRKFESEGKPSPWDTDAEAMWRKTPLRQLAKRMPRSTTDNRGILLRAVMIDEYGERKGLLKPTEEGFVVDAGAAAAAELEQEPIQPTTEKTTEEQLRESIELVNAGKKGGKPGREKKKPAKEKASGPPPANIPAANFTGAPAKPGAPPTKMDDPVLTVAQQTLIFNTAIQAGWKIPEEFNTFLVKNYKLKSIREVRNSQFAEILQKVKSGT